MFGSFCKIPWITAVNKVLQCLGTILVWLSGICRRTRCYWHLVSGGQDPAETVYKKDMTAPPQQRTTHPPTTKQQCLSGNSEEETGGISKMLSITDLFSAFRFYLTALSPGGGRGDHLIFHTHFAFRILSNLTNLKVYGDFCPVQGEWLFIARAPEVLLSHRNLITKESMPFPNSNPNKKLSWTRGPNTV